jgi:hypothetical protein
MMWFFPKNVDKQKRFLKACQVSIARIYVKKGRLRQRLTDPALYEGRKAMIPELDSLFRQIAKTLGSQRILPSRDAVIERLYSLASDRPNVEWHVGSIANSLTGEAGEYYLESLRGENYPCSSILRSLVFAHYRLFNILPS